MESLKSQNRSSFLKAVPTPIAGLMLGFATAGNMLGARSGYLRGAFGAVAIAIFIILIAKALCHFDDIKNEFSNVAIASVMPTFSMGGMVISTYIQPFSSGLATCIWYLSVLIHIIFMVLFTVKYVKGFKIESILPSWYIVYVGIAVAAVTGKMFNPAIGKFSFYFGFAAYIVLIPFVLFRVYKINNMKRPALPSKVIMTAPGSLCLAGYMGGIRDKNSAMVMFLLIISQLFYILVLTELPKLLRMEFYPSFSAFTFPMVISGLSMKLYSKYLMMSGNPSSIISAVGTFEEIVSVVICLYVLYRYVVFISNKVKA